MLKKLGIKGRVLLLTLLPTSLMALVLGGYFTWMQQTDLQAQLMTRGEMIAEQLAPLVAPPLAHSNADLLERIAKQSLEQPDVRAVSFLAPDRSLLAHAGPLMLNQAPIGDSTHLLRRTGNDALAPLHRIDRETAGLVVFSLRPQDRAAYQALFRERSVHKVYEAIASSGTAHAWPLVRRSRIVEEDQAFFRMGEADGEPNSETHMDRLETRGAWARYRLEPVTGKRHQLRVHMNALGLPIAGDQFYPRVLRGPDDPEDFSNPLRLLAQGIAFTDPVTGEHRRFGSKRVLAWPA